MTLEDRVALVTGASRGIGLAIAEALHGRGARVALLARTGEALQQARARLGERCLALEADLRRPASLRDAVKKLATEWGPIHILVNNAGTFHRTPVTAPEDGTWDEILDTNLRAAWQMVRLVLPHVPARSHGRIINVASILGKAGNPGYSAYCAAKHGLIGLTRALALELIPLGVTVNAICPGWVDTELSREGMREAASQMGIDPEMYRKLCIQGVPMQRFVDPAEVAGMAAFLAEDGADAITGQALNVCCGAVMV